MAEAANISTEEYYIRVTDGKVKLWCCVGGLTDSQAVSVRGRLQREFKKNNGQKRIKLWSSASLMEHWQVSKSRAVAKELAKQLPTGGIVREDEVLNVLLDYGWEEKWCRFKLFLDDQELTADQCAVLNLCVDVANRVRDVSGGERIEKKYTPKSVSNSADPISSPSSTTSSVFPLFLRLGASKSSLHRN